ncbi:hypothetical protein CaCOL14_003615 [Colletotrichum acutatum]
MEQGPGSDLFIPHNGLNWPRSSWIREPVRESRVACSGVMDPFRPFDKERRRLQEKDSHWHAYLWCIRLDLGSQALLPL